MMRQFDQLPDEKKQQLIVRAENLIGKEMSPYSMNDDDLCLCIWYCDLFMPAHEDRPLPDDFDMLQQYLAFVAWLAELKQEWVRRRLFFH